MRGLSSWIFSQVKPWRSSTPGPKFSTSTSQCLISASKMILPCGVFVLSVRLRLLPLSIVKYRLSTPGMSCSCSRVMSPRPGSSTLITSAPSHASSCVLDGPDCTWVMSRMRMPSRALPAEVVVILSGIFLLVHRLVFGPRRIRVGIEPDVHDRAGTRSARTAQGRPDLFGIADGFAVDVQHVGELLEVDVAQVVADVAAFGSVLLNLSVTDLIHIRVVADDGDVRQFEPDRGLHVEAGHRERAVAEQRHDFLIRVGEVGRHRTACADAERAEIGRAQSEL